MFIVSGQKEESISSFRVKGDSCAHTISTKISRAGIFVAMEMHGLGNQIHSLILLLVIKKTSVQLFLQPYH